MAAACGHARGSVSRDQGLVLSPLGAAPPAGPATRRSRIASAAATWLPLLAWLAAIYWFSDQPDLPHASDALLDVLLKKAMHAGAYGVLAWLWRRALSLSGIANATALALVLTVACAAVDELHQSFVPGRSGRAVDVGIDALGALAALAAIRRQERRARE